MSAADPKRPFNWQMAELRYATGEEVQIGDIIRLDNGHGPQMRVVVIIPAQEAAEGFTAEAWAYLKRV